MLKSVLKKDLLSYNLQTVNEFQVWSQRKRTNFKTEHRIVYLKTGFKDWNLKKKEYIVAFFYSFLQSLFLSACSAKIDLALLIDGSSSVERYGVGNFRRIIDFVRGLTMGFAISRRNTRVSLIVYGTRPKTIFNFRRLVPSKIISYCIFLN